jgi:hypothetical protein
MNVISLFVPVLHPYAYQSVKHWHFSPMENDLIRNRGTEFKIIYVTSYSFRHSLNKEQLLQRRIVRVLCAALPIDLEEPVIRSTQ